MTLTLCDRCGRLDTQGVLSGYCATCAPPSDVLDARQDDVDKRHRKAKEAAQDPVTVPKRRPSPPAERPRLPAFWRMVSHRSIAVPHLFAPGADVTRSLCGTAYDRGRSHTPEPGQRGCRRCALAAGWIASLSEPVTT